MGKKKPKFFAINILPIAQFNITKLWAEKDGVVEISLPSDNCFCAQLIENPFFLGVMQSH